MDTRTLDLALGQLAPTERRAVEIVYGDGRGVGEAARQLGVSAQVVSRRLAAAHRVVARYVLDQGELHRPTAHPA